MNVRIAGRGHSFKGAGLYYLHDKDASTQERVGFTYTHNISTTDPDKAVKWMIFTAKNSDVLKEQAGIKKTGAKRTQGTLYSYSINYEDSLERPSQEQMIDDAQATMKQLGFDDHQALFIEHTDTDHPHVHVMVNMISPTDGRIHVPSWSYLKSSDWALAKELEQGRISSPQRVENNERRKNGEFVKYQEKPHNRKALVQKLYARSDSGQSFRAALKERGLELCRSDRRGWVLVDQKGKIHSLSRQLDKDQRKTYQDRLESLDSQPIPLARDVSEQLKQVNDKNQKLENVQETFNEVNHDAVEQVEQEVFDRDQYEIDHQNALLNAADNNAQKQALKRSNEHYGSIKEKPDENESRLPQKTNPIEPIIQPALDQSHLAKLDRMMAWNKIENRRRAELEEKLTSFYEREEMAKTKFNIEQQLNKYDSRLGRLTGKYQKLKEEHHALTLNLENIDLRISEQWESLEIKLEKDRKQYMRKYDKKPTEVQKKLEAKKAEVQKRMKASFNRSEQLDQ